MEPADYIVVEDIEVFEVLNNPLRLRILRLMMQPVTVREIAEGLDVPATRLYYHVNLLEEAGIVSVVDTRKAGAMLQKVYLAKARGFKPSPALVSGTSKLALSSPMLRLRSLDWLIPARRASLSSDVVVKVIDRETDTVIKEIPPRELQIVHARIREALGALFDVQI